MVSVPFSEAWSPVIAVVLILSLEQPCCFNSYKTSIFLYSSIKVRSGKNSSPIDSDCLKAASRMSLIASRISIVHVSMTLGQPLSLTHDRVISPFASKNEGRITHTCRGAPLPLSAHCPHLSQSCVEHLRISPSCSYMQPLSEWRLLRQAQLLTPVYP